MTAIFAYVAGPQAIIASDTLRRDPLGLFVNLTVKKVYCWSNCILFAGAGNGPRLEKLASDMLANQTKYSPDEAGIIAAFRSLQPTHYAHATSGHSVVTKSPRLAQGTFLVAVPEMKGCPAKLFELDFATGDRKDLLLPLASQGTNPTAFLKFAQQRLAAYRTTAGLPGDLWAGGCVSDAIAICSQDVGFPFDVIVTGPNGSGGWQAHHQRFSALPLSANSLFLIR